MKKKSLRYRLGMICIVLGIISPLFSLLVPLLHLPLGISTILVGLLMVGGPEVFLILGAVLAGKEAVQAVKAWFMKFFHWIKPSKPVSKTRYYIGLLLFGGSIMTNWILQYALLAMNFHWQKLVAILLFVSLDLLTIISFFVLGAQFWDKLRALFYWDPEHPVDQEAAATNMNHQETSI